MPWVSEPICLLPYIVVIVKFDTCLGRYEAEMNLVLLGGQGFRFPIQEGILKMELRPNQSLPSFSLPSLNRSWLSVSLGTYEHLRYYLC